MLALRLRVEDPLPQGNRAVMNSTPQFDL